jgi:hypothetical protein
MAVVVPASDSKNYAKYQEYIGVVATVANTSSTVHKESTKLRQIEAAVELITSLMHSGKLTAVNLLAAGTYGT